MRRGRKPKIETEEFRHPMDRLISAVHTTMESFFDGSLSREVAKHMLIVCNEEAIFESPVDNGGRTQEALDLIGWAYNQVEKYHA